MRAVVWFGIGIDRPRAYGTRVPNALADAAQAYSLLQVHMLYPRSAENRGPAQLPLFTAAIVPASTLLGLALYRNFNIEYILQTLVCLSACLLRPVCMITTIACVFCSQVFVCLR